MRYGLLLLTISVLFTSSVDGFSETLLPPIWRGQSGTTFLDWGFNTGDTRFTPDAVNNPFGSPVIQVVAPENYYVTYSNWNMVGIWSMDGATSRIEITIPDQPNAQPANKDIWVQMIYLNQRKPGVRLVQDAVLVDTQDIFVNSGPGYDWWLQRTHWQIDSHSVSDTIVIDSSPHGQDWAIDRVIIDTRYTPVPEPSSMLLCSISGLVGVFWRRKSGQSAL